MNSSLCWNLCGLSNEGGQHKTIENCCVPYLVERVLPIMAYIYVPFLAHLCTQLPIGTHAPFQPNKTL